MGAYLQTPVRDKVSEDKSNDKLTYGASSMQGWRISQEDAHTCLLDFDKQQDTSMFAVYDGHGGAEVAEYTAAHLPDFLKEVSAYKDGQLGQALEDGFLQFDGTLVTDEVVRVLKDLAQTEPDEEENEEEEAQETAMLFEEASMPLEKLLERYSSGGQNKAARALRKKEEFQSPLIRAKKDVNDNSGETADSLGDDSKEEVLQMDEIKIKLDDQLTNGNNAESAATKADTDPQVKHESESKPEMADCIDSSSEPAAEKCVVGQSGSTEKDSCAVDNTPRSVTEAPSSTTSNGTNSVESPSEGSACVQAGQAGSSASSGGVSSSSDGVQGSSSSVETAAGSSSAGGSTSDAGVSSSSGGGGGSSAGGSGSSAGGSSVDAGGSSADAGGSSVGGSGSGCGSSSSQAPEASSSSGRTRKARKNTGEEDEDESSCSDDEDEEEAEGDEDEWETSDDEEEDIDNLVQPDSEDDDVVEGAPCVHAHAHDDDDDDDTMMTAGEEPGMDSGCTAVVALLKGKELFVGNAGDSRCVLCRAGKAIDMSEDHKPEDEIERNRIRKAGGKITMDGRVNGGLNLSRAIGDHSYKQKKNLSDREQMITSLPDVRTITLEESDEFMVLACDGIWNVMSSQDVVTFVRERLATGVKKLSLICEEMFDSCMSPDTMGDGTGCDNMTCIIVTFSKSNAQNQERGEKRPADTLNSEDVKEPDCKRQKADDG